MTAPAANVPLIRVIKGHAEPAELAALTAVLFARATAASACPRLSAAPVASWSRPERIPRHCDPRSRWAP